MSSITLQTTINEKQLLALLEQLSPKDGCYFSKLRHSGILRPKRQLPAFNRSGRQCKLHFNG